MQMCCSLSDVHYRSGGTRNAEILSVWRHRDRGFMHGVKRRNFILIVIYLFIYKGILGLHLERNRIS